MNLFVWDTVVENDFSRGLHTLEMNSVEQTMACLLRDDAQRADCSREPVIL